MDEQAAALVVGKAEALQSGRNFFVPYDLKRRIFVKDGAADLSFRLPRLPLAEPVERRGRCSRSATATSAARCRISSFRIPLELRSLIDEVRGDRHAVARTDIVWQKGGEEPRTLQSTNEELETTNEELSVLSSIHQGVVVVDRGFHVVAWSRRATDLWGLRDDEVEGEHLLNLDIGIPVQRLRDPIRHVLAGADADILEVDGHDRRGKPVHVRIAFAPLRNRPEAEEPDGAILLVSAERA
ncbi:MAG: PAS domain-containing protein [Gaiellaceae bacterium]